MLGRLQVGLSDTSGPCVKFKHGGYCKNKSYGLRLQSIGTVENEVLRTVSVSASDIEGLELDPVIFRGIYCEDKSPRKYIGILWNLFTQNNAEGYAID